MPINLSIKNVPDEIAAHLRWRAAKNHRSLQGEFIAIIEEPVTHRELTPQELLDNIRGLGLQTSREAQSMVREDRDAR